jgi:predicted ArsR family transcriptional regulator
MAGGIKPATLQARILSLMTKHGKPMSTPKIAAGVKRTGSAWVLKALLLLEARGEVISYQWHYHKQGRPARMWALAEKA